MSRKVSQWSLRSLLIATAVVPLAIYMLVKANAILAAIAILFLFGTWIASMVVALVGRPERRAFAGGVLVAITIYGGIVLAQEEFTLKEPELFTSTLLHYVYERCVTRTMGVVEISGVAPLLAPLAGVPRTSRVPIMVVTGQTPTAEHFAIVGHVYWAVLFGLLCGWTASWLARWEQTRARARPISATID